MNHLVSGLKGFYTVSRFAPDGSLYHLAPKEGECSFWVTSTEEAQKYDSQEEASFEAMGWSESFALFTYPPEQINPLLDIPGSVDRISGPLSEDPVTQGAEE